MTYTTATTIKGPSRSDPETIYQWAKQKGCARPDDVRLYLTTLSKLCRTHGLRFEVLASQSVHEATEDGIPWNSYWWKQRCNPGGIGITGDPSQNNASRDFKTGDAAARAHFLHAYLYAVGTDIPSGVSKSDDPRYDAALDAGYAGIAPTMQGFQNTWGMDDNYANAWVGRLNALEAAGLLSGTPAKETTVTTFTKYAFPGLKNPVYLPSWIVVEIKIIPSSVAGWTSGQKIPASNFTSTTYHDTGNDESSATSEYNWAAGGGRAEINSAGSYNGIFDKTKLIISQRFDELVGHAADPTGNVTSYAFEEAYGAGGHDGALEVGMWVHAGVLQAMGKTGTGAMYQHNYWSGKNCPGQIRARGQWSYVEKTVDQRIDQINAYLAGGAAVTPKPIDPPVVVKPSPVVYPPNITREIAAIFFGKVKGNDSREYGYDENGPVSQMWLAEGKKTGTFPHLVTATVIGSAKYFAFSNGLILFQPSSKEVIRQYSAA